MNQEREFDTYLKGESDLSQVYADLPEAKLPAHLDAAILAEAHRAVGARPGGKPGRSWVFPLSMAASLFVVVVIALQLPYLMPVAVQSPTPHEARQQEARKDESALDRSAPAKVAPGIVTSPAVAPSPVRPRAPESNQPEIPPAAPAAMAPTEQAAISSYAPAPRRVAPEPEIQQQAEEVESKQMADKQIAPAPSGAGAAAGGNIAARQKSARLYEEAESRSRMELKKEKKAAAPDESYAADQSARPAPVVAAMSAPGTAPVATGLTGGTQATNLADTANLPPKEWLARIRQLKQQGKLEEARKELVAFRKRYPDYPVPKDMDLR